GMRGSRLAGGARPGRANQYVFRTGRRTTREERKFPQRTESSLHVESDSGDESLNLTVLESVCCLECGAVYAKPTGGGTVRANPGCPDCGYVGWVAAGPGGSFSEALSPRHFDADRLPPPHRWRRARPPKNGEGAAR